ncbi:MAG: ABC transporter ATP-binding protein [Thermoproteus sp.]|jgi:ABC-2 type transport system ATP-binding protein
MDFVVGEGLRKRFVSKERMGLFKSRVKVVEALAGVDISIGKGRLLSLVGPNGAGKTTLVRIFATLLLPDGGRAYVGGFDVVREADKVRRLTGLMLYPDKGFFGRLTGLENLVYYGMLYGMGRKDAERRALELLELVGLWDARHRPYEEYSMGMKARLGLAKALMNDPELLLLDEPTVGVDPLGARKIREVIKELKKDGKTVLFTSHNLYEVEELSDEVALIVKGRILAKAPPDQLKKSLGFEPEAVVKAMCNGREEAISRRGGGEALVELVKKAAEEGCTVLEAYVREPPLEEVVVKTIGGV